MPLVIVRHAPTLAKGVCYGQSSVATAIAPHEAAELIADRWPHDHPPSQVWSSPLPRCRDVASHLATRWSIAHTDDPRLMEVDFGRWEGRTWDAIEADEPEAFQRWMANWMSVAPPKGERVDQLEARVKQWWEEQCEADRFGAHRWHLMVGHAGVIRALRVIVHGASWEEAMGRGVAHLEPELFGQEPLPTAPRPTPHPRTH
ncbi:MAG: histidine phosphatase family protein [Myxococcota bacterium]